MKRTDQNMYRKNGNRLFVITNHLCHLMISNVNLVNHCLTPKINENKRQEGLQF